MIKGDILMLKVIWNMFLDFLAAYSIIFSIALVVFYICAITIEDYSFSNYVFFGLLFNFLGALVLAFKK